jgi:hypothetical protein
MIFPVFLFGEISPNLTWKIWFRPIRRIFHETIICQILKKRSFQIIRFLWYVPVGSQEYRRILFFFYFHSQIWLNHLMDARHFSCITKLIKIIIKKTTLNPCISPLAWPLGLWLLLNGQSIIWLSWQVDISLQYIDDTTNPLISICVCRYADPLLRNLMAWRRCELEEINGLSR